MVTRRVTRWFAAGLLFLAVLYLAYGWTGTWNHQRIGATTLYWAGIAYTQSAILFAGVCLLTALALGLAWFVGWLRKGRRLIPGSAVLIAFGAVSIALIAVFPAMLVRLYHRDSAHLVEHTYHLALRTAFDGDNLYILYECDLAGLVCTSNAVSPADTDALGRTAILRADAAANTLALEVDGEPVATYPAQ
jgi:hypothetical protein